MQSLNSCFGSINYPAEVCGVPVEQSGDYSLKSMGLSFSMTLGKMAPEKVLMKSLLGQQSTSVLILCISEVCISMAH